MHNTTKISALAIIYNEEQNIRDYLNNFSFADEIIVVDSFSTDNTLKIIREEFPNVFVYQRVFDDFSSQRNYTISKATNDWVVFFDADERVSQNGINEIITTINKKPEEVAFWVKRQLFYKKKPMYYGGLNKDKAVRVFRKSKCHYSTQLVHEQLIVNGKSGILKSVVDHYSFVNKISLLRKRLSYSKLRALELKERGINPNYFHFKIKPLFRFCKHYFLQLGFLNGKNGYELAQIMRHHVYMRYVYLNELYESSKTNSNIGYEAKRIYHNTTGLGNYSRDLIRIMSDYFPQNNYFLYNPSDKKKIQFNLKRINVVEKKPKTAFNKLLPNYWRQYGIIKDLKNDNITFFHGLSGELPFGLKKNGIKSVVTIHDLIFLKFPQFYNWFDRAIYSFKFKKAVQHANHVIAISEQTKKDIIEYFKIESNKITVLYQGCNDAFKKEYTLKEKNEISIKLNLPDKFILNVGTIEERKNIFQVVKALKGTSIPIIIVGKKTKYSDKIEDYIKVNKMINQVIFLKGLTLQELAILYQTASIFIYPSLYEGFGIPIIEALFSKTPVITSNRSCLPEAGGKDSIYINPDNVNEIRESIITLWNDEDKRKQMAIKGYEYVQKFNDSEIAKEMNELYLRVQNNEI